MNENIFGNTSKLTCSSTSGKRVWGFYQYQCAGISSVGKPEKKIHVINVVFEVEV